MQERTRLASLSTENRLSKQSVQESSGNCKYFITKTQMLGLEINFVTLLPSGMELNQCLEYSSLYRLVCLCSSLTNIHIV